MFPESLEDYGYGNIQNHQVNSNQSIPQASSQQGRPNAVQRLVQPTHQLKNAIMNLINYQEDADVTIKAIPELIKLLNDDDKLVKDASKFALSSSQNLIAALVNLILNTNDLDLHQLSSSILNNLSSNGNKQALYIIFKSGGISALIKLLSSQIESVVFYATTTLHNLLMHEPNAKAQVHHYNGTRKMVELLSANNNVKFLALIIGEEILCLVFFFLKYIQV